MRWPASLTGITLAVLLVLAALGSLASGAMNLPAGHSLLTVFDATFGSQFSTLDPYQQVVILELRLPRLLLAILVGAILAQCGAVMQGLFRNPLADPGIIGVSSGAAFGAIAAIVLFHNGWDSWSIPLSAFSGGLLSTLLVYTLARSQEGTSIIVLLLAGVAIAAFAGAATGFLAYFADDQSLRELSVWQMGSLAGAAQANLWLALICLLGLAIVFQKHAQALNALLLGESEARHLGIAVERLKLQLIVMTSIGVGVTVACAGIIGFVGLVVPHLIRIMCGPDHRHLLPLSALMGALLLVLADWLARLLVQPAELPVGLVTALLGAPFFLVLLMQQRQRWSA